MKSLSALTLIALFTLGLAQGVAVGQETPAPSTAPTASPAPAAHPVEVVDKTTLSYYQLSVIGLLTVIAILLGLAMSQLSGIKGGIDKLASK